MNSETRLPFSWSSRIIGASLIVMIGSAIAFVLLPVAVLTFIPVFLFYFLFGVSYPTLLGLFSGSVSEADQGWVMGVTTAVFCLAGGVMSVARMSACVQRFHPGSDR